jgi:aryl-alcohol dehydrogenase-like predicted oxidoreductase
MKTRFIGPEKVAMSAVGYGCPPFQGKLSPDDGARAVRVLERAVDLGVTYIDAADHNKGNNEELLAPFLTGKRERVVLSTKFGNRKGYPGEEARPADGRPEMVVGYVDASLKRLQTDYVDILYLHRVDPKIPIEETIGAMKRLVEAGKARHIGISEAGPETLRRAHAIHPITAVQSEYSLLTREYEGNTLPACRELGIGFVAYYPTGRGFLAGKFRSLAQLGAKDNRRSSPRFREENLARNLKLLDDFTAMASERGCTTSQLALAWVLAQGNFIVPIPGTMNIAHLEENVGAAEVVLSPADVAAINNLFAPEAIAGARFQDDRSKELNI